ncbi:MAG: prepilin-type N-terminal cleavage/methylation domain-containing protein [Clostridia bacterium]|nr:prepilin-type N-terminal cleavage/methylation domain-containing protein [Clostridia bacterium]MDD4047770.1 prepilin-type N-terminal cleavage/methylation domain-containing protein [Clostridia bacterium]
MNYKNRGTTLIEIMIGMVVLSLLIVAVGNLLDGGIIAWARGEKNIEAQQNLNLAMNKICHDIRLSKCVLADSTSEKLKLRVSDTEIVLYKLYDNKVERKITTYTDDTLVTILSENSYVVAGEIDTLEFIYKANNNEISPNYSEVVNVLLKRDLLNQGVVQLNTSTVLRGKFLPRR